MLTLESGPRPSFEPIDTKKEQISGFRGPSASVTRAEEWKLRPESNRPREGAES